MEEKRFQKNDSGFTCRNCGFENVSHFIQLFKRIQHITPYQYAGQVRNLTGAERGLSRD